ncbi:hypothetical protein LSH36_32g04006 [Paralvinella palmiformis]|uniref:E3 ubiquitin-protein ligase UBR5 ubiquitin-associated domain-containing protein n=1 Tax=Paralvinella palmiformis TaxID=53620 RepID=A0AAD9K8I0_9ANNE|nr:hypothetical protein LSH36_32g04006 [Paralvinella palmiformis]
MSSLHFVVHPLPGTEDQLNDRLKDISERISHYGYSCPSALHPLRGHTIQNIAVGPNHIALLLEDGRVCRLSYSVLTERLDLTKSEPKPTSKEKSAKLERNSRGIRIVDSPLILVRGEELGSDAVIGRFSLGSTSAGNGAAARNNNTTAAPTSTTGSTPSRAPQRQRGSRVMRCVGRGRGTGVIVGNVPGRGSLLPSSALPVPDELINQCQVVLQGKSRSLIIRELQRTRILSHCLMLAYTLSIQALLWMQMLYLMKICLGILRSELEQAPDHELQDGNCARFSHIAAMHSELVAININGQLCQWKWFDPEPFSMNENPVILHPKASSLALAQEKIIGLVACSVRASVWAESGKVATWVDDSLNIVCAKLEHPAQMFAEFQTDRIVSLHVCSLYTCARLESGNLYWWGVMPFGQRKKVVEKARSRGRRAAKNTASEIVAGMQVCLRSCPIYHVGAVGFTTIDGIPKVGQLMESAWTLNDTRRFKIKTSFIEPKPELKPEKRKKQPTPVKEVEKKDEEEWSLKDVIFTEDIRTVPVGRVLKVDGAYAAVRFPGKDGSSTEDPATLFQDCRLLRKDDLVIVRGSTAPKIPDCFQKTPKKINLPESGKILTVAVDSQGIHMVCVVGTHFKYFIYDLSTSKMEQSSMFPTDTIAFLGQSERKVKLHNAGENSPVILCDGNSTIYPLGKDCLDGIRDPRWLDLPPLHSLGMAIQSLPNVAPNSKNKTAVIVMAVETQALSVHILRHDLERVKAILAAAEGESDNKLKRLLQEHTDGNRNIFHTAVTICIPSTNKDTETELQAVVKHRSQIAWTDIPVQK